MPNHSLNLHILKLMSFNPYLLNLDTGDLESAQYKLVNYFLREFTEISLYSSGETKEKVPLPTLYMAMQWSTFETFSQDLGTSFHAQMAHKKVKVHVINEYSIYWHAF